MATSGRKTKKTREPEPAPRPGPKPGLSTEAIVKAAIEIADREGLEAVTMQRLGEAFGFTPMSLYRYVRNKAELVDAMIEAALGAPPARKDERAWRARLEEWARGILACFVRHPWALGATSRLRTMGANELAWADRALGALAAAGLSPADQHGAFLVLIGHVRSVAQFAVQTPGAQSGVGLAEWRAAARAEASAELPALHAALEAGAFAPRGNGLASGLRIVFEGIAALGERREART
jgi:AcrR family transcriptional regulator